MNSNGFWIVLVINILLIPAILLPTLSRLAYFEAFSLFAMIGAASPFILGLIKMTMLSDKEKLDEYGIEPITANTDVF